MDKEQEGPITFLENYLRRTKSSKTHHQHHRKNEISSLLHPEITSTSSCDGLAHTEASSFRAVITNGVLASENSTEEEWSDNPPSDADGPEQREMPDQYVHNISDQLWPHFQKTKVKCRRSDKNLGKERNKNCISSRCHIHHPEHLTSATSRHSKLLSSSSQSHAFSSIKESTIHDSESVESIVREESDLSEESAHTSRETFNTDVRRQKRKILPEKIFDRRTMGNAKERMPTSNCHIPVTNCCIVIELAITFQEEHEKLIKMKHEHIGLEQVAKENAGINDKDKNLSPLFSEVEDIVANQMAPCEAGVNAKPKVGLNKTKQPDYSRPTHASLVRESLILKRTQERIQENERFSKKSSRYLRMSNRRKKVFKPIKRLNAKETFPTRKKLRSKMSKKTDDFTCVRSARILPSEKYFNQSASNIPVKLYENPYTQTCLDTNLKYNSPAICPKISSPIIVGKKKSMVFSSKQNHSCPNWKNCSNGTKSTHQMAELKIHSSSSSSNTGTKSILQMDELKKNSTNCAAKSTSRMREIKKNNSYPSESTSNDPAPRNSSNKSNNVNLCEKLDFQPSKLKAIGRAGTGSENLAFSFDEFVVLNSNFTCVVDALVTEREKTVPSRIISVDNTDGNKSSMFDHMQKWVKSWVGVGGVAKVSKSCSNTHMMQNRHLQ